MHGFGPVEREQNEPAFHAAWEAAVYAIMRASMSNGLYNLDEFRHGVERMDPAHYLRSGYYEHWLDGITRVLVEKGVVSAEELERRTEFFTARPDAPATTAVRACLAARPPASGGWRSPRSARPRPRRASRPATRWSRGISTRAGIRAFRATRGASAGVIARAHGAHVFPDTNAHGAGEQPQTLYSVRFDAREMFGETAEANQRSTSICGSRYLSGVTGSDRRG